MMRRAVVRTWMSTRARAGWVRYSSSASERVSERVSEGVPLAGKNKFGFQSSDFSSPETDSILLERCVVLCCECVSECVCVCVCE
jgi:hypothetical protein